MSRRAAPPDFRYVGLAPASASTGVAAVSGAVALATCSAGFCGVSGSMTLLVGVGASVVAALGLRHLAGLGGPRSGREVTMAIVPWGVVVSPEGELRVLRWPAIRRVRVEARHALRGGTPSVVASVVTVETERETLAGQTNGSVGLERLVVGLPGYAAEASRPVAADLDGETAIDEDATEPVVALLLRRARELCTSARGAAALALPPGDYRTVSTAAAGPETVLLLRAALADDLDLPADPRPLAAIVAAVLDARELVPDLLRLVSSPHPVVAAVAKAAALRLGAPRNRAGAVDEVAAFLFDEDLGAIQAWADEGQRIVAP